MIDSSAYRNYLAAVFAAEAAAGELIKEIPVYNNNTSGVDIQNV